MNGNACSGDIARLDVQPGQRVKNVRFTKDTLRVDLIDGRSIRAPLVWYLRILHTTPQQRENRQRARGGYGLDWPDVDEDLSVEGLLRELPASLRVVERLVQGA